MAIQEGPAEIGEKGIRSNWPVEEGTTAGTTRQTGNPILAPERESLILRANKQMDLIE